MYFNICDEVSIRNYNLKGNESILIRVLEPSYKVNEIPYTINNLEKYKDVLELYIEDTIVGYEDTNNRNVFDYEKAKILNNFILNNNFDEVVVHCSLGISRSPAIMICIAMILNNVELENIIKNKYRFYNLYIVDVFKKSNYSVKKLVSFDEINGNVLSENNYGDDEHMLKKFFK